METFKLWILSLCGATAITSLCKVFLSKSKLQKITNVFFSVFVLLYTILPIQDIDLNVDDIDNIKNEDSFYIYYQEGYEVLITESIINICDENNINVLNIEINSYINEENYLVVNKLTVDIEDNSRITYANNVIKKNLNFEVNVI